MARMVKEAKVRMARDTARKASQAKGTKLIMAIEKQRWQVASTRGIRRVLQSLLEMASHGKGLFHVGKKKKNKGQRFKGKKCWQS